MLKLTGEKAREKKRIERISKVSRTVKQLFEAAFSSPKSINSESTFLTQWSKFEASLLETFGSQKDIRQAFKKGEYLCRQLAKEHGWVYSPPTTIVTNTPPKQLRNPSWLKDAWSAYDLYEDWQSTHLTATTDDVKARYQALLLSLIFESGQTSTDVVRAFNRLLMDNKPLKLKRFSNYVYLPLFLENSKLNTNCVLENSPATLYRCYLSIQTLAQLNLWRKTARGSWRLPISLDKIYTRITANMPKVKLPSTLQRFCSGASMWYERNIHTDISQALIEFRVGRTPSYSIPEDNLIQLLSPTVNPVACHSYHDFKIELPNTSSTTIKRETSSKPHADFIYELKETFKSSTGHKLPKDHCCNALEKILEEYHWTGWQVCFIEWLMLKLQTCSVATTRIYKNTLIKDWIWLHTEANIDATCTTIELQEKYLERIYRHTTAKSQAYFSARLYDLHAFVHLALGLPTVSHTFFKLDSGQKHTNASIVSEPVFVALLEHIKTLTDISDTEKLALQTMCILAYRCGLRPIEAQKLQMGNISACKTVWLEIRTNRIADNKTASSLRQVPVMPMLLSHEREIVERYLRIRYTLSSSRSTPLFTMDSNPNEPLDIKVASRYICQFLKVSSGLDYLEFYSLRHSCLSRLQMILEHDSPHEILPNVCSYDANQLQKVRHLLFKKSLTKGYWEISTFAGHQDPSMTFRHYLHLSDWLSAPPHSEILNSMSKKQAIKAGLSSRRQYQAILETQGTYRLIDALEPLCQKLSVDNLEKSDDTNSTHLSPLSLTPDVQHAFSIELCYQVLDAIASGIDIDEIAFKYRLDKPIIEKWTHNAKYLSSLTVDSLNKNHGAKRHISPTRQLKLVPGRLKSKAEYHYLNKFNVKLRNHYKLHKTELQQQIEYCLTHASMSQSGVYFSSPDSLTQFIDTFSFAIPKTHWRAMTLYMTSSHLKGEWKAVLSGIKTKVEEAGSKQGRGGHGAVRLELISPAEEKIIEGSKFRKYSSHLLVFVLYFTFIMVGNVPQIENRQKTCKINRV